MRTELTTDASGNADNGDLLADDYEDEENEEEQAEQALGCVFYSTILLPNSHS